MNRNIKKNIRKLNEDGSPQILFQVFFLGKSEPNSPGKEVEKFFKGVGHIFLETVR